MYTFNAGNRWFPGVKRATEAVKHARFCSQVPSDVTLAWATGGGVSREAVALARGRRLLLPRRFAAGQLTADLRLILPPTRDSCHAGS
jgi:hypothetical protein